MARPFLRILLISLLQYAAESKNLEPCPSSQVCVLITKDKCKFEGLMSATNELRGYIYEDAQSCEGKEYSVLDYARLDIKPTSMRNWSFALTYWDTDKDYESEKQDAEGKRDEQHMDNLGFSFGTANLTFVDVPGEIYMGAKLDRFKADGSEVISTTYPVKYDNNFKSTDGYYFNKYKFIIEMDEKLVNIFAVPEVKYLRKDKDGKFKISATMKDRQFGEKLSNFPYCDPKELHSVCHGTCDDIEMNNSSLIANCSSSLWIHDSSKAMFTREWKPAEEIECDAGSWTAKWKGGFQVLDRSYEVQCAREQPAKMTGLAIGCYASGGIFAAVALIVILFLVWRCKRNSKQHDNRFGTTTRSDSKAETPGKWSWKMTGKSDRPSTDIEGLHTEKLSKGKETNIEERFQTDKAPQVVSHTGSSREASTPGLYENVGLSKESPSKENASATPSKEATGSKEKDAPSKETTAPSKEKDTPEKKVSKRGAAK